MEEKLSASFPRMVINVDMVGDNSLLGALFIALQEKGLLLDIGVLNPDEIVFVIKKVHGQVNLYNEINKVRDVLKIDEKKITVFML